MQYTSSQISELQDS